RYENARAAIAWLTSVLGCTENVVYPGEGDTIAHAQLEIAGNLFMLGSLKPGDHARGPSIAERIGAGTYIAFDDAESIDALYRRVTAAGADIIRELQDTDYGSREFGVRDPEGHMWSFGTYKPQAGA
ncbi:MAG TPA: VOC family protein, partial [Candidatus Tumulicola sp.]